jgi:hypothetical protein
MIGIPVREVIHNIVAPIDTEAGRLTNIPDSLIRRTIFMSANAILQAFADVILEAVILLGLVTFKIPFRLEFLFLTLISTVIAYLTLKGIRAGDLDVTRNTLLLGLIVETSLVIGDLYLLFNIDEYFWTVLIVRIPFMVLTSANIYIISRVMLYNLKVKKSRPHYRF